MLSSAALVLVPACRQAASGATTPGAAASARLSAGPAPMMSSVAVLAQAPCAARRAGSVVASRGAGRARRPLLGTLMSWMLFMTMSLDGDDGIRGLWEVNNKGPFHLYYFRHCRLY